MTRRIDASAHRVKDRELDPSKAFCLRSEEAPLWVDLKQRII